MMKKIIAAFFVILFCGTAFGAKYPELGMCTGERIRLRETLNTKGKVIGFVEPDRNHLVILGEVYSDGLKWNMVEHPTKKGTAYIASDYVLYGIYRDEDDEVIPAGDAFVNVRVDFGIYPEKTAAILGVPVKALSKYVVYRGCLIGFNYDDDNGIMTDLEIFGDYSSERITMAGIRIMDKAKKLTALGMPIEHLDDVGEFNGEWKYWNDNTGECIRFRFGLNEKKEVIITAMNWHLFLPGDN